jgi:hypothetical protein
MIMLWPQTTGHGQAFCELRLTNEVNDSRELMWLKLVVMRDQEAMSHHSIALRTFDGRSSRFKTDGGGRSCSGVAAAIFGQSLDGDRQTLDPAEPRPPLDPAIVFADAGCRDEEAHSFSTTAVQREGDPDILAVIASQPIWKLSEH